MWATEAGFRRCNHSCSIEDTLDIIRLMNDHNCWCDILEAREDTLIYSTIGSKYGKCFLCDLMEEWNCWCSISVSYKSVILHVWGTRSWQMTQWKRHNYMKMTSKHRFDVMMALLLRHVSWGDFKGRSMTHMASWYIRSSPNPHSSSSCR